MHPWILALLAGPPATAATPDRTDAAVPDLVADRVTERIVARTDRALDGVDATAAQHLAAEAVATEVGPTFGGYLTELGAVRERLGALFEAETVDHDAVEAARVDLVDLFDRATATWFDAAIELSTVLTTDQRAVLRAQRRERIRERWRDWLASEE
ncbi:MAG: hypothetical protein ABMB14_23810 [Myxococcota bacterium]